jgi:hypothetical protein
LKAAIDEGHRRGMKITGHLCSVTYGEAADLRIDVFPRRHRDVRERLLVVC